MKLNGGHLWEKLDPNPNSTIILGEVFIQRHVGKKQYSLQIDTQLSETRFKINTILIKL